MWELRYIFFSSVFSFCKTKSYYYWKHIFCRLCASRLLQIDQKSEKWQWRHNFLTYVNFKFFWRCFISLVNFSYVSKFHVNIITGSGSMTIFFYNGLTRNPEFGNAPVWVLPNIWRLGRVMDTKFDTKVSNRKFHWMLQNSSVTAFTVFELLRDQLGWVKLPPPRSRRLGLNYFSSLFVWISLFLVWKSLKFILLGIMRLNINRC